MEAASQGEVQRIQRRFLGQTPGSASTCCWLPQAGRRATDHRPKWPLQSRHLLGTSLLHTKHLAGSISSAVLMGYREQSLILPSLGSSQHQRGHVLLSHLLATGKHFSLPGLSDGQSQMTPQQVPLLGPRGREVRGAEPKAFCMGKSLYPQSSWLLAPASGVKIVLPVFPGKLLPSAGEAAHSCVRDGWKRFGVQVCIHTTRRDTTWMCTTSRE